MNFFSKDTLQSVINSPWLLGGMWMSACVLGFWVHERGSAIQLGLSWKDTVVLAWMSGVLEEGLLRGLQKEWKDSRHINGHDENQAVMIRVTVMAMIGVLLHTWDRQGGGLWWMGVLAWNGIAAWGFERWKGMETIVSWMLLHAICNAGYWTLTRDWAWAQ